MKKLKWCANCLNMSTRPRIEFDERGWCNACQWMEEKKTLDWEARQRELSDLLAKHRSNNGDYDCLVPVSGGKDGSYVAYQLKHKFGMNPLTITVTPPLSLEIGDRNLRNFIESGYEHIQINPNPEVMRALNKAGLIQMGSPYFGWLVAIKATVIRMAHRLGISLIFYGEDGEVEYGGSSETKYRSGYDVSYIKRVYFEGGYDDVFKSTGLPKKALNLWRFPSDEELKNSGIYVTHWSYFEPWDSYRNYLVAKDHCGLEESDAANSGTFTNFAQNDQALYALHTYLMYLKFGFGRATQDVGIEIRRGAMDREQGKSLVLLYDNQYPEEFIDLYLDYYRMSRDEFDDVLDNYANKDLFSKEDGRWMPKFDIE